MEFFIHPWAMAAGGALVSSPILIHLINRMNYKRIRWAAMEFLLKSQKRNRRRLILEQLILLLLRILLVLLLGFLLARFRFSGTGARGATHVVILDDSLSMADRGKVGGKEVTAYTTGIDEIKQVVRQASQASSVQNLQVFLLSQLDRPPILDERIGSGTVESLDAAIVGRGARPTFLHLHPLPAFQFGRKLLNEVQEQQKILHFVSDFRDSDWAPGPDGDKLRAELVAAIEDGIRVNLMDVASPFRQGGGAGKVAQHNDNLAIVDFEPSTRVAVEETEVNFVVKIMNYGTTEGRANLKVFINGQEDLTKNQIMERIPAGRQEEYKFALRFPRSAKPGLEINEKDPPEERERKRRQEREFFHVRVNLGNDEPTGLLADNVRDLAIEVRRKVPILVVDGNRPEARGDGGDLFHIQAFFAASAIYDLEERKVAELEKTDLDLYPAILLLNVPDLTPGVVTRLKSYVEQGGSLCYFLGEDVKSDYYNNVLFKNGLFPLQIGDRPFDPLQSTFPDPEARAKERERLRQTDNQPKMLVTDPKHMLVEWLASVQAVFRFLGVNIYWKALPRSQWDREPYQAQVLLALPNANALDKYKTQAQSLMAQAVEKTKKLAEKVEYQNFVKPVEEADRKVREALARGQLFELAEAMRELISSEGARDNPNKPNLGPLWDAEPMKALREEIKDFREMVLFGDPLLVTRRSGKGRVVAMLTPAGTILRKGVDEDKVAWNTWGAGHPLVAYTYAQFLIKLHSYLISEGQAPNRLVGETSAMPFDATRYERRVSWTFTPQPDTDAGGRPAEEKDSADMEVAGKTLNFQFKKEAVVRPGFFRLTFTLVGEGPPETRQETRGLAFNVDAVNESDLKRTTRDQLEVTVPGQDSRRGRVTVRIPNDPSLDEFQERTPDASETPWLYLFILLILIVEQAMAVRLSHHLRPADASLPAGVPAAA
jgi:hypothetical protein